MDPIKRQNQLKASWLLLLATFFWGGSFIVMKGLTMLQEKLVPGASSWFLVSLSLVFRFGIAAILLILWNIRSLRQMTHLELWEGAGLGIIGGLGIFFQMDGVAYTSASTAAFLTQCYCIFIPLLVACRRREWPSRTITFSTAMVMAGVAVLSQFDFREMRLGRGEWETLIASLFFTAQILWLERPMFSRNNPRNYTVVMFVVLAVVFLPVILVEGNAAKIFPAYSAVPAVMFSVVLTIFCTIIAYGLMNYWQPHVAATQAGLIYCTEPVFTSIFALFMPAWLSSIANVDYSNEQITVRKIVGGGLITVANVLVIIQAARASRPNKTGYAKP